MHRRAVVSLAGYVGSLLAAAGLRADPPIAVTRVVASGIESPLFVCSPPGDNGRLFVVEYSGKVRIVKTATWTLNATPYLDITALTEAGSASGGDGILGFAFDPAYATSGNVYVYYIPPDGSTMIARFHVTADPDVADSAGGVTIWRFTRPGGHRGGWLAFSPVDGFLYLASGDGGTSVDPDPGNRAQDITSQQMGKLLRIDPFGDSFPADANRNYRIPAGNPFVGVNGDDEIWAYGLRNPWRDSFDRANGDLWVADVGWNTEEEVDYQPVGVGGRNYGWRCTEGTFCTGLTGCTCNGAGLTPPLYRYDHSVGACITGGYVYRGSAIPALQGRYLYGDFIVNRFWSFVRSGSTVTEFTERTADLAQSGAMAFQGVVSFGEDAAGELYICDFFTGGLYKVVPPDCPVAIQQQPGAASVFAGQPLHLSVVATGAETVMYRWSHEGVELIDGGAVGGSATANLTINPAGPGSAGNYTVRVWNACGPLVSSAATVQVFCRADWDQSGAVDPADVAAFVGVWFASLNEGTLAGDFDGSGAVDPADVAAFVAAWFGTLNAGGC